MRCLAPLVDTEAPDTHNIYACWISLGELINMGRETLVSTAWSDTGNWKIRLINHPVSSSLGYPHASSNLVISTVACGKKVRQVIENWYGARLLRTIKIHFIFLVSGMLYSFVSAQT